MNCCRSGREAQVPCLPVMEPEVDISEELVRDVLREQHPDLADLPIREVEGGWGNQMWRLGDDLAVRMQRMDPSPDLQLKERRWLPLLAPRLPLPIPTPVRTGTPSERFPKLWTVMTWVDGTPLDHATITHVDHAADMLAAFLTALHVPAPADAPGATDFGTHPKDSRNGFEHFLGAVDLDHFGFAEDDVRAVWDDAAATPEWPGPRVWVHGDLHPANVVVAGRHPRGHRRLRGALRRRSGMGPRRRLAAAARGRRFAVLRQLRPGGRGDPAAGARAGRDEVPVPDADGPERGPRPARRQTELGTRRPVGT